jgi:LCP family protein required for cell wall assembly
MNDIDLLDIEKESAPHQAATPPRTAKRRARRALKLLAYLTVAAVVMLFIFTSRILMSEDNPLVGTLSLLNQITHLAQTSENMLKGETDDRVNILLLGMGGKNHDGGYLTDTIMLASFQPSTNEVALLSIPRDLVVPIEGKGFRKVNNVNAYAEVEEPGSGGQAVSQSLSKVLDMPIDYYVRVDFSGFVKIIDELGGVDVNVERTLDDPSYPIMGEEDNPNYDSRYEHLHIDAGLQHMDGSIALKFARSRHGLNGEGSDFARSRRQQLVLAAVKEKILNLHILFKPRLVGNILSAASDNISTNLQIWEVVKLWDMAKNVDSNNIVNKVLDNSVGGLLVDSMAEDGAYILTPRTGSFDEIQYLAQNIFTGAPPQDKQDVAQEYPKVEIQNGTWVNGLGQQTATDLEKYGFEILTINNAGKQNYEQTTIYDLTYGEKMKSIAILKDRLHASIHYGLPDWLITELATRNAGEPALIQPDFIVILGQTADATKSGTANEEQ